MRVVDVRLRDQSVVRFASRDGERFLRECGELRVLSAGLGGDHGLTMLSTRDLPTSSPRDERDAGEKRKGSDEKESAKGVKVEASRCQLRG